MDEMLDFLRVFKREIDRESFRSRGKSDSTSSKWWRLISPNDMQVAQCVTTKKGESVRWNKERALSGWLELHTSFHKNAYCPHPRPLMQNLVPPSLFSCVIVISRYTRCRWPSFKVMSQSNAPSCLTYKPAAQFRPRALMKVPWWLYFRFSCTRDLGNLAAYTASWADAD